jgi:hypothetical protein
VKIKEIFNEDPLPQFTKSSAPSKPISDEIDDDLPF